MSKPVTLLAALATLACAPEFDDRGYATSIGIDWSIMEDQGDGLLVGVMNRGSGPAARRGFSITVHYTGWLQNGRVFDTSRSKEPATFTLGGLIEGWNIGMDGMRVGERRMLVIPPELGYGSAGSAPRIPPEATLVFEVELLAVGN